MTYNESNILLTTACEHIRLRPGMYLGSVDSRGLHRAILYVVDNSIDSALAHQCDHIWIYLKPDNEIAIRDNGMGIPVSIDTTGTRLLEKILTNSSTRRVNGEYESTNSIFRNKVWLVVTNALSSEMKVEVGREGYLWQQTYEEGVPQTEVMQIRELKIGEANGTHITFKPDFTIFEKQDIDFTLLCDRANELAALVPGLTITLIDERSDMPIEQQYHYPQGLKDYIATLNAYKPVLCEPIQNTTNRTILFGSGSSRTVSAEFAIQFVDDSASQLSSYANTTKTTGGGTHLTAMRGSIVAAINDLAETSEIPSFIPGDILKGVSSIIAIQHEYVSFESQSDVKLLNPEVFGIVAELVYSTLTSYFAQNPETALRILQQCLTNRHIRENPPIS